jgi:hypothetical protein
MSTRFSLLQRFAASPDDVARAFVEPGFYALLDTLPNLGEPAVLAREVVDDHVRLRIRYRFTGSLSSAARAVLDPSRLTWVEESDHDLAGRRTTFRLVADHYADRLRCSGEYRFRADGAGTIREATGEIQVRTPLVGGRVERALISGIQAHLEDEVAVVERWLSGAG